jgi:hypothetical protein
MCPEKLRMRRHMLNNLMPQTLKCTEISPLEKEADTRMESRDGEQEWRARLV